MKKLSKIFLLILLLLVIGFGIYYRDNLYKYYTDLTANKSYQLSGSLEPTTNAQLNVTQINGTVTKFQNSLDKAMIWKNYTVKSNTVLTSATYGAINQTALIRVRQDSGIISYESDWFVVKNKQNVNTEIRFKGIDMNFFVQSKALSTSNKWIDISTADEASKYLFQVAKIFSFLPSDLINSDKKLSDTLVFNNQVVAQPTGSEITTQKVIYTYYRDYLNSGLLVNPTLTAKLSKYSNYILRKSGLTDKCVNLTTEFILGCNEYYWFLDDKGNILDTVNLISKNEMFVNNYSNIDNTVLTLVK